MAGSLRVDELVQLGENLKLQGDARSEEAGRECDDGLENGEHNRWWVPGLKRGSRKGKGASQKRSFIARGNGGWNIREEQVFSNLRLLGYESDYGCRIT